jgi:hypothetical protein
MHPGQQETLAVDFAAELLANDGLKERELRKSLTTPRHIDIITGF